MATVVAILVRGKCVHWVDGDSAETCAGKFPLMSMGGLSGGSRVRRPGSEDPHRCERKFCQHNFIKFQNYSVFLAKYSLFQKYVHFTQLNVYFISGTSGKSTVYYCILLLLIKIKFHNFLNVTFYL